MYTHPGTKLMFQGGEFGQSEEWNFSQSLDWHLLEFKPHKGLQTFVKDLNSFYKTTPALYEKAFSGEGFEWINYGDHENSVISYIRKGHDEKDDVIVTKPKTTVNTNDAVSNSEKFNDPEEQYQEPLDSDDVIVNIPNDYCLMANYPNPFNPSTTIRYGLPEQSDIVLQIYNIKGQLVKTLEKSNQPAGYHEVTWYGKDENGKIVSSGIYFYKLNTDKFISMKRMLLIK